MELGTSSSAENDVDWRMVPFRFQEEAQRRIRQVATITKDRDHYKSKFERMVDRYKVLAQRYEDDVTADNHVLKNKLEVARQVPTMNVPNEDRNATSSSQVSHGDIR